MKSFLVSILVLALAGCAASPRQIAPVPKLDVEVSSEWVCRIHVLLPHDAAKVFPSAAVREGSESIGVLGAGQYLVWERAAKEVVVAIDVDDQDGERTHLSVDVPCAGGTAYYYSIRIDPGWDRPRLRRLESGPARKIIAGLELPPHD